MHTCLSLTDKFQGDSRVQDTKQALSTIKYKSHGQKCPMGKKIMTVILKLMDTFKVEDIKIKMQNTDEKR